jgi:hypothetical protein
VTSLIAEFDNNIIDNIILLKSSILVIIRFQHQGYDNPEKVEGALLLGEHTKKSRYQARSTKIRSPLGQF